ncbi:MAG: 2-oxoacid:acceptor oxidoreductase subunit alpha [Elusimicrobiota bacterium]
MIETFMPTKPEQESKRKKTPGTRQIESVTIRFAGDSGDGVQLTGGQFSTTTALVGNDLSTLPDFPAEIRAPAGSVHGVSGFQIHFSSRDILTPGDRPQVLVAFNPAALKANIKDLEAGGVVIVNTDAFTPQNFKKAGIERNPLEDNSLSSYRVIEIPMATLTGKALEGLKMSPAQVSRCKNFMALGIMYWLYERPLTATLAWIRKKFAKVPISIEANTRALNAGYSFADTTDVFPVHYRVKKAPIAPGTYRNITGNEATALGVVTAGHLSKHQIFYGTYPITPASDILHSLSKLKAFGVKTFQAEDEIAAVGAALGASFAGSLGVTGTSGPGVALKAETIGLAVMTELPLVILAVQRGGPSTGLPTKTEQADLLQALYGRNGESPIACVAPATPSECFSMAIEACRLAMKYRHPVFFLSDGYLANGSEPWKLPEIKKLPKFDISHKAGTPPESFEPYRRDKKSLARPWVLPGTPGYEHRIGGIEGQDITGDLCYDPDNHAKMVRLRAEKVERMAEDFPPTEILGPKQGKLLVVGWGSTYGAIATAVREAQARSLSVSAVHLRYLNPLPKDLGAILKKFDKVLVPEMNLGQLLMVLRAKYLIPAVGLNKVKGQPFMISEIRDEIARILKK